MMALLSREVEGPGPTMPRQPILVSESKQCDYETRRLGNKWTKKRCQFRQKDILVDERETAPNVDCPFSTSEGAISFSKELEKHNEQYFYDVPETDVHL